MLNVCLPKFILLFCFISFLNEPGSELVLLMMILKKTVSVFSNGLNEIIEDLKCSVRCGPNKSDDNFQRSSQDSMADERTIISKLEYIF